jgi:hypothetical protein
MHICSLVSDARKPHDMWCSACAIIAVALDGLIQVFLLSSVRWSTQEWGRGNVEVIARPDGTRSCNRRPTRLTPEPCRLRATSVDIRSVHGIVEAGVLYDGPRIIEEKLDR